MKQMKRINLGVFLLLFIFGLLFHSVVFAEETPTPSTSTTPTPTPEDKSKKLEGVNNRIKELEEKLESLEDQEKSLSSQIGVMDNQIQLTEYRIDATQAEIDDLNNDIELITSKVSNLETNLEDVVKTLQKRAIVAYESKPVEPIEVFLGSENFFDFVKRSNYVQYIQENDKKLVVATQQAKSDYENQQNIFEQKKQKVETLKAELETYTKKLDEDKKAKQDLLEVTKNDEKQYQALLASARSERSAIEGVVSSIKLENGTPISKGQVIAVVGNSGAPYCSTGPHLHFEVRQNGGYTNPASYLRGGVGYEYSYGPDQYGYYGSISPSGGWDWPLSETVVINQGYGSHGYATSFYPSGSHTGIDMVSRSSSLIKAVSDGTLYSGSTSCSGASMNYVAIDHGGGIVSWYWHVQ